MNLNKFKRDREIINTILVIAIFFIALYFSGCSMLPKSSSPLVDLNNAGVSGNEIHVVNSTGSVVNSSLNGISIGTVTVTMQTKAINVEKEAVKFIITVPVKIVSPVRIMENVNTNVLFWQVMIIIASIISGCVIVLWLILRFKK